MRLWPVCLFLVFAIPLHAQDDLPEGKGKETLENTCTECHGLDKALNKLRSRESWHAIAITMRDKGATMSDEELETLVDYLALNFGKVESDEAKAAGPPKAPEKIYVNTASAKELEAALQITPEAAAAMVRYRERNGPFKQWRDLLKVKEVDKARIEAKKDRLAF